MEELLEVNQSLGFAPPFVVIRQNKTCELLETPYPFFTTAEAEKLNVTV